jgi:hypothetical protein
MTENVTRMLGFIGFFGIIFSFLSITVWTDARRKEREAFYRNETVKKIAESPTTGPLVLEFVREHERNGLRRMHEGIRLGGLIAFSVGIGLMIFLWNLVPGRPVYLAGLMPIAAGGALFIHGYFLVRRE